MIKGRLSDWIILKMSKLVYSRYSDQFIKDRINYMYSLPYRIYDKKLYDYLVTTQLFVFEDMTFLPHNYWLKPQHSLICFRKKSR